MNRRKGLTRVEVIVAAAGLVLLVINLQAFSGIGRERAKREVCLANLRTLTAAWQMYADNNGDKIINGDAEEYGAWGEPPCTGPSGPVYTSGGTHYREKPWVMRDWGLPPCWPVGTVFGPAEKKEQIKKGALYSYVKDIEVYKCPRADTDETRSFSVVDQMNVMVISQAVLGAGVPLIKSRQYIKKAYERMIFLDDGGNEGITMGGWTVSFQNPPQWWDAPSARHGDGTTFSFVDGHAEYRKWLEPSTLDCAKNAQAGCSIPSTQTRDIRWAQIAAWGSQTASELNP